MKANKFNIGDIVSIECDGGTYNGVVTGYDEGDYFVKELADDNFGLWEGVPFSEWDLTLVKRADAEYII